jgi:hypothetical protein
MAFAVGAVATQLGDEVGEHQFRAGVVLRERHEFAIRTDAG